MAKRKRPSSQLPAPDSPLPDLPPELALDDAGPPSTADEQLEEFKQHVAEQGREAAGEQLEEFKQHVAEQGREAAGEIEQATPPVVPWQVPPGEPQQGPAVVAVEIPLAPAGTGYTTKHVEVRLTAGQARALRRLGDALEHAAARVSVSAARAPRPVQSAADAVRWLLEQIENAKQ